MTPPLTRHATHRPDGDSPGVTMLRRLADWNREPHRSGPRGGLHGCRRAARHDLRRLSEWIAALHPIEGR